MVTWTLGAEKSPAVRVWALQVRVNANLEFPMWTVKQGVHRGFLKLGVPLWGPHNKDYSTLGSILGSPIEGDYHIWSFM